MSSKQIQKIVLLCAHHQNQAPEFLELLSVLVKVEGLDMTIKRNQALVMKYIMQNYRKAAYVLDQPRDQRFLSQYILCKNYKTIYISFGFLKFFFFEYQLRSKF